MKSRQEVEDYLRMTMKHDYTLYHHALDTALTAMFKAGYRSGQKGLKNIILSRLGLEFIGEE